MGEDLGIVRKDFNVATHNIRQVIDEYNEQDGFCLFVYFFFILGPYSEGNLSIPLFFHMAQIIKYNITILNF